MRYILIGVIVILIYVAGKVEGEAKILGEVKDCIEASEDWDDFLEYFSDIWKEKIG